MQGSYFRSYLFEKNICISDLLAQIANRKTTREKRHNQTTQKTSQDRERDYKILANPVFINPGRSTRRFIFLNHWKRYWSWLKLEKKDNLWGHLLFAYDLTPSLVFASSVDTVDFQLWETPSNHPQLLAIDHQKENPQKNKNISNELNSRKCINERT